LVAWVAVGVVALFGAVGLGMGLNRWLVAPSVSETPRASTVVSDKAERTTVLDYYVQIKGGGKMSGAQPLKKGQPIKLHFVGQQSGYLYLLGHQGNNRETHLTQNPASGQIKLSSNKLGEKVDFIFPGEDGWLEAGPTGQIDYTVIFSSQPLSQYDFLTTNEIRKLTPGELEQLEGIRQRMVAQGDITEVKPQETRTSVTLPTHNVLSGGTPHLVIFDISLRFF
jgi:hypothetical protein